MIQIALWPMVICSVGFQLSYLAMAGITLLYPKMKAWWPEDNSAGNAIAKGARKIWEAVSLSISCQAFTAPAAWIHFRTFPPYFLITNLIALPMASMLMVLVIITVILSAFGLCHPLLLRLSDTAISTLAFCLKVIADL